MICQGNVKANEMILSLLYMEYAAGLAMMTFNLDMATCIGAVQTTVTGVMALAHSIANRGNMTAFTRFLIESDLRKQTKRVETLLLDINTEHCSKSLILDILDLQESLEQIRDVLNEVNKRIIYNDSVWVFSSLRSYGFTDLLDDLQMSYKVLVTRENALRETLKINHMLRSTTEMDYTLYGMEMIQVPESKLDSESPPRYKEKAE